MKASIFFLFAGLLWACSLTAQVVYVDDSNTTGVEDGTPNHPFNTLEEGMSAAVSGKTLLIRKGNYTPVGGTFFIKPGVKLEGESRDLTIIKGSIKDTATSTLPLKVEKLQLDDMLYWRTPFIGASFTETSYVRDCKCRNIKISHGGGFSDATKTAVGPVPWFEISGNNVLESIVFSFGVGLIAGENKVINNKAGNIGLSHGSTIFTSTPPIPASGYLFENNELTDEFYFSQGSGMNVPVILRNNKAGSIAVSSGALHQYTFTGNVLGKGYFDSSKANRTLFSGNTILNGIINDSSGGYGDGSEDAVIENNTINYVYDETLGRDIITVRATSVTLRNNTITGTGGVSGMNLKSGAPTNVVGNKITLNNGIPVKDTYGISTSAGYGLVTGNEISGAWTGYYSKSGAVLFDRNNIKKCHNGLYSMGLEEVSNNTITDCSGHGMILNGLKGPVSGNTVTDNDSTGIWVIKTVDLGGGGNKGAGRNILRGNGYFDLRISTVTPTADTLYINNNVWDHQTVADVLKYDLLNESTNPGLVISLQSVIALPSKPLLTSPGNGTVITSSQVALAWEKITGADSCRVQMATDQNFTALVSDTAMASVNSLLRKNLVHNVTYFWRVKGTNLAGGGNWSETRQFSVLLTGIDAQEAGQLPRIQCYPNPFSGSATIRYFLPMPGKVRIALVDPSGRMLEVLVNETQNSGEHFISLEGRETGKGLIFCRMETEGGIRVIRLVSR